MGLAGIMQSLRQNALRGVLLIAFALLPIPFKMVILVVMPVAIVIWTWWRYHHSASGRQ